MPQYVLPVSLHERLRGVWYLSAWPDRDEYYEKPTVRFDQQKYNDNGNPISGSYNNLGTATFDLTTMPEYLPGSSDFPILLKKQFTPLGRNGFASAQGLRIRSDMSNTEFETLPPTDYFPPPGCACQPEYLIWRERIMVEPGSLSDLHNYVGYRTWVLAFKFAWKKP